ncbi:MAG: hypothetical protein FWF92_11135 [Oscillospiraceae bacterium]|nr:hypothetical protein [Oscillospiraceae bacterium]
MNEKKSKTKKLLPPILVAVIIVIIQTAWSVFICAVTFEYIRWYVLIFIAVPLIAAALIISVLISRIKEIIKGEEDEASKY